MIDYKSCMLLKNFLGFRIILFCSTSWIIVCPFLSFSIAFSMQCDEDFGIIGNTVYSDDEDSAMPVF